MNRFVYKILVYTSVFLFMLYYFRAALPYIEYEINKEYIAENLCQNKDKPFMNCKGKCYLKKQVKKAEKEEKKQNPFITSENSLLFFFSAKRTILIPIKETINNFKSVSFYSFEYIPKLLKPPQLFS